MKTKIGGQAVIEGVMMRGATSEALSCRDEAGEIRTETKRLPAKKPWYRKVPFLRGVANLIVSMLDGTKTIAKSAEIMVEEVDTSTKKGGFGWLMTISTLLGVLLALAIFVVVPTYATKGIFTLAKLDDVEFAWLKSLLEGVIKILVLVIYMASISGMKEIRRVFMYHGAEHKTIACYEAEMPLTVENVQKCSRYHDRCGTSFIVFVVILSVVLMMVLDVVCVACNFTAFVDKAWLRALLKIALLPVTAGISYEMLMLLARSNFVLFRPLKWMGKQFQKLTTKEPTDDMCEVAIKSFQCVLDMDADPTIEPQSFPLPVGLKVFKQQVVESGLADGLNQKDVDWLVCTILNIKPEDLNKDVLIPFGWTVRLNKMVARLKQGEPFAYVVGGTTFYNRTFNLTKDVLIPRVETELVCEQMLKHVSKKSKVLDLCCGSGVLGITAALEKGAKVTLADVSKPAIAIAKQNAKRNKAKVKFVETDMFAKLKGKFNVIVCNPPYVPTGDIATLDASVKDHEPHIALDGGVDGLDFYRTLASVAPNYLTKGGALVLEIGYNQGEEVVALLADKFDATFTKDYSGNDRIVVATLK